MIIRSWMGLLARLLFVKKHRKLLEKFHMIKEHKKAGGIDNDTFELLRMEIFEDLGLEP